MKKEKIEVTEKVCRRCGILKPIADFRTRPFGFTLNQCKCCERELAIARRTKAVIPETITITTKSGKMVEASLKPINGGRMTTSPLTEKVLYFSPTVNRDTARIAFSAHANIPRTGIQFKTI